MKYPVGPLVWTDSFGCIHTMHPKRAKQVLKHLYDEWPGGFEEIEASIQGHKRVIERLKNELLNWHYTQEDIEGIVTGRHEN